MLHRAETLAQELKDLQAELGDYNTVSLQNLQDAFYYNSKVSLD